MRGLTHEHALALVGDTQLSLLLQPLRQIVEMADDARPPVRHGDPLDPPIVSFDRGDVLALLDGAQRVIGLAGAECVTKPSDGLAGERVGPEDVHDLGEVAADEWIDRFEHFSGAFRHARELEVQIHDVDAERGMIDEMAEGVVGLLRRLLGEHPLEAASPAEHVGDGGEERYLVRREQLADA